MDFVRTLTRCSREEGISTRTGRIPCAFESPRCLGRETASVFHGLFHALCLSLRSCGCWMTTRTQSASSPAAILPRGPAGGGAMAPLPRTTAPPCLMAPRPASYYPAPSRGQCGSGGASALGPRLAPHRRIPTCPRPTPRRLTATRAPACGARPWRLRGGPMRRGRRSRSRPAGGGVLPRTSRWRRRPRRAPGPPSTRG